MQDIHRKIHTFPFFYNASRVPHQLRVAREVQLPIVWNCFLKSKEMISRKDLSIRIATGQYDQLGGFPY